MIEIVSDDKNLVVKDMTISATVFAENKDIAASKICLLDFVKNPIVKKGDARVGYCESIRIVPGGIVASIQMDGTPIGVATLRWFKMGLVWSFVSGFEPTKYGYSLVSLGVDPYAPIK